jgi:hypothetical protein
MEADVKHQADLLHDKELAEVIVAGLEKALKRWP